MSCLNVCHLCVSEVDKPKMIRNLNILGVTFFNGLQQ